MYSGEKENKQFKTWIRMIMSFPFLMLEDVDEVWEEMLASKPVLGGIDDEKVDQFVDYFEKTWLNENCHFPRSSWKLYKEYSSRTNNISERFSHQMNGQVLSAKSNIQY